MNSKNFEFLISGTTLKGQYYLPEKTLAVIVLVHGMGEYSKRYERQVVPFLLKNSLAVVSYDQFGHGSTIGKLGYQPGFSFVLNAVEQAIAKARNLFPDQSVFLYGHSMGGNVVINYALRRSHALKGVIATSPFLRLAFKPPRWKMVFAKILDRLMPSITMSSELDITAISRDKEALIAYEKDPLIHDRISTGYSLGFMETGEWAIEHAGELKSPMLLLHGTKDRITSYLASQEFALNAKGNVELVLFEDAYHELHHDLDKEKVFEEIRIWINNQLTIT